MINEVERFSILPFYLWLISAFTDSQGISFEAMSLLVWIVSIKAVNSLGVMNGAGFPLGRLLSPPHPYGNKNISITCFGLCGFCISGVANNINYLIYLDVMFAIDLDYAFSV